MATTRRTMLAGLTAVTLVAGVASGAAPATSQGRLRDRKNKGAPQTPGPYGPAADYSAERSGVSFLVMSGGKVLFESYPEPGGSAKGWELASGTKSFTGVMAAAASADGLLDIDEPCARTLSEWAGDPRKSRITIRHLLTLTSGLAGEGIGRPPPYAEAILAKSRFAPGAKFEYGPAPFQAFGEVLQRKLKAAGEPSDPSLWLQKRVFDRIGIRPTDWKRGSDGNPLLPQGAHFTARDWATFGQWVIDGADGVDPKVRTAMFESTTANPGYGLSWWLLRPGLIGPSPRSGVDAGTIGDAALTEDIVMAAGAGNQRLYLLRKRRLVVVRQANDILRSMGRRALKWEDGEFLALLPQTL